MPARRAPAPAPAPAPAVVLVLALALLPPRVAAQGSLEAAAGRVAEAWSRPDVAAVGELMSGDGIGLHLEGESHPVLGRRQALSALGDFLKANGPGTARVGRVEELGGEPRRGFAELEWSADGAEPFRGPYTVFVGFSVIDGAWRIVEIRVFEGRA